MASAGGNSQPSGKAVPSNRRFPARPVDMARGYESSVSNVRGSLEAPVRPIPIQFWPVASVSFSVRRKVEGDVPVHRLKLRVKFEGVAKPRS
jgi:hypothetical protein